MANATTMEWTLFLFGWQEFLSKALNDLDFKYKGQRIVLLRDMYQAKRSYPSVDDSTSLQDSDPVCTLQSRSIVTSNCLTDLFAS